MNKRYVEVFNLRKSYDTPDGPLTIVEDISFSMSEGEFACLLGHSGCGKSTVLSIVAGLVEGDTGGVAVDNREVDGPGPDRAMVFQSPNLLPWLTALQNVMLGVNQVYRHVSKSVRTDLALYYLDLVGLLAHRHAMASELSQGMQQRVSIARAVALQPKLLLLDEPFGMLDSLTRMELQDVMLEVLARENIAALMVTHDVDEALLMADRVLMMTNGPRARIGADYHLPFPRPRERAAVLQHPDYYPMREQLMEFLEAPDRIAAQAAAPCA
ncbi:MAG: ABC transporter ATP-binding protein [Planctomycetota bacterium]|nr:MAG: ABC transporter ATP-binding protein [Planctomycetota bacterium]